MPKYTKQHYEAFAKILKANGRNSPYVVFNIDNDPAKGVVMSMVEMFSKDNPRFNKDRFLEAIYG